MVVGLLAALLQEVLIASRLAKRRKSLICPFRYPNESSRKATSNVVCGFLASEAGLAKSKALRVFAVPDLIARPARPDQRFPISRLALIKPKERPRPDRIVACVGPRVRNRANVFWSMIPTRFGGRGKDRGGQGDLGPQIRHTSKCPKCERKRFRKEQIRKRRSGHISLGTCFTWGCHLAFQILGLKLEASMMTVELELQVKELSWDTHPEMLFWAHLPHTWFWDVSDVCFGHAF